MEEWRRSVTVGGSSHLLLKPALNQFYEKMEGRIADGLAKPIHYGVAIIAVALAFALRYALEITLGNGYPFILFYPAIFFAAWYGGMRPGLLATVLSTGLAFFFIKINPENPVILSAPVLVQTAIFFLSGCLFSVLMDMMHYVVAKQRVSHRDLATQHEWFRVTLRSIGDAVLVTDRNGLIEFMNGEAERLSGWSAAEAKHRPLRSIFRIINEDSRNPVDDPVEKVFKENRVVGLANHTLLISKDGTEWPIEDSASPICDDAGVILGVVLVFHDATETRRGQKALKIHAEELERKVLERTLTLQRTVTDLEAFSYTVSHDLRSPLRAMLGYSSALIEDYSENLPPLARDYLGRIGRAAERLDHLIQDLLTFSHLTTEKTNIGPVDLNRLLHEIIQQYPDFHGDNADIVIDDNLPSVMGHESALTQVFANLIGNGIKFVPAGRRPKLHIRAETSEHVVRLSFEDNGIGIAPENYTRIFKIFEQINQPGTYIGTGIGLALVKKAVEKMQGTVGIESELGQGSKFWVELIRVKQP